MGERYHKAGHDGEFLLVSSQDISVGHFGMCRGKLARVRSVLKTGDSLELAWRSPSVEKAPKKSGI
jgi:hypothetical protein